MGCTISSDKDCVAFEILTTAPSTRTSTGVCIEQLRVTGVGLGLKVIFTILAEEVVSVSPSVGSADFTNDRDEGEIATLVVSQGYRDWLGCSIPFAQSMPSSRDLQVVVSFSEPEKE